jgi:methyl-accepting chemotaxis protein
MRINMQSIQFRLQALIAGMVLLLSAAFFVFGLARINTEIANKEEDTFRNFFDLYQRTMESKTRDLSLLLDTLLNDEAVLDLLAAQDREGLFTKLESLYKNKLLAEANAKILHFHTPDNKSILRFHKKDRFGDDLSGFRKTIVQANAEKTTVRGLEIGAFATGLRVVKAIMRNAEHLGSVELSGDFFAILEEIAKTNKMAYALSAQNELLDNAGRKPSEKDILVGNKTFFHLGKTWNTLGVQVQELEDSDAMQTFTIDGRRVHAKQFPLKDYAGQMIGSLVMAKDISAIHRLQVLELRNQVLIFLTIMLIIAVSLRFFFYRILFTPLRQAVRFAKTVRDGDYTATMVRTQRDEIGVLVNALNEMVQVSAETMGKLSRNGERLLTNAKDLIDVSRDLGTGSRNLNTQTQLVDGSNQELRRAVQLVNTKGREANDNLQVISAAAEEMSATIAEISRNTETARENMGTANSHVQQADDRVQKLGVAAKGISEVVNIIVEIAEQTKLLALNATIEASRAGEAGRGFTVVANEIKELAAQTNEATADIAQRIQGIQSSTQETIQGIDAIKEAVGSVNDMMGNIAAAVEEQAVTTKDMADNILHAAESVEDVHKVIQDVVEVANTLEENVAAVDQLGTNVYNSGNITHEKASRLHRIGVGFHEIVKRYKLPETLLSAHTTEEQDFLQWNDQFSVGVAYIDTQHRSLVSLINRLYWADHDKKGKREIEAILEELLTYTDFHFKAEERLMTQAEYSDLDHHKILHKELVRQVLDFINSFKAGKQEISSDIMDFLKNWLLNHINKEDRKYGPAMKKAGIQ